MANPSQLSFLPDDYLQKKAIRRTNTVCAVLFILVLGGIGSAFTIREQARKKLDAEAAAVEKEYLGESQRIEQVRQMQDKQKRMDHQVAITRSLLEKVPRSFILAEFTNSLPAGVSLLDFNLESKVRPKPVPIMTEYEKAKLAKGDQALNPLQPPKPSPAEPKLYDVSMKVTGIAPTDVQVAQYLNKLSKSKLLKDVNLVVSEETAALGEVATSPNAEKVRKFQIEMMLDPEAEITPEKSTTAAVEVK